MRQLTQLFIVIGIFLFGVNISLKAQEFIYFEDWIEFEGQRFLMNEIYEISSSDIDRLRIEKIIREKDMQEGFDFVLTSYSFNGEDGVVITSINRAFTTSHQFINIHLTHKDFNALNDELESMARNKFDIGDHLIKRFNKRLILDVQKSVELISLTLWIDTTNRHTFTLSKWRKAMKRYNNFIAR